jgi:porin-like protein
MKSIRGLLLGTGAVIFATAGAQAADLPLKAKAVEYVRVCSLYGAGFYYIPGTDTCIKLGGYLRAETALWTNSNYGGAYNGVAGAQNRLSNTYQMRSREDFNIDTRTATEYGVVRTYADLVFTWTSGSYNGIGNGGTQYSTGAANSSGLTSVNGLSTDGISGGSLGVYYAFIQFAGFTIGKAISNFSMPWTNYPGNIYDGLVGGGGTVTGVNQFTYTAQFGNGVEASIGAQDPVAYYQAGVNNVSVGGAFGAPSFANTIAPDIVASVQVDQAWGLFKASVAAHDNHASYYGPLGVETNGHPSDVWGFAVQAGFTFKNIPTGAGDTINISGVYTDGATRYNIQDLASQFGAVGVYGGTGLAGAYQSIALAAAPDTVYANGGSQQLVQTWGMRGAFNHNWNPYWSSALYGAFAQVQYNGTAKALICGNATWAVATVTTCNPDYNIGQLGVITRWTPVKNLTFSADLTWQHIDQKMVGTTTAGASATIGKPAAVYELRDQDNVLLMLRAQRNW